MTTTFRQPDILDIARRDGQVTVDGLARRFGVTRQTIRRDLAALTDAGVLDRVHGGAVLPTGAANIEYEARRRQNAGAKRAIGCAAAAHIPDGASVFLDIGTTSEAVAQALRARRGLLVVTNNLHVASILGGGAVGEVIVTGGSLRQADDGLVGPLAARAVEAFRFDHAILACSAVDDSGAMLDFDLAEVEVSRALIRAARHVTLVADQTKFRRAAPMRIGGIDEVHRVITEASLPGPIATLCARAGVSVEIARVG